MPASAQQQAGLTTTADRYFATDPRPIVLFDGVCNMCNGFVNFMLDGDKDGWATDAVELSSRGVARFLKVRFAALQSEAGRALLRRSDRAPDDISSIVLVEKDGSYIKSEAVLKIARYLDFPFPPLSSLGFVAPGFLRDSFYDLVANNRYSILGKRDSCRITDNNFKERFIE
eukprot:SM000146S00933  [mRNA]  locus=s146:53126:54346:+ [translate_table: standard]